MAHFYALLATLLSLSATVSNAESVSVQCGESKGWAYYFAGGLVPDDMEGFTEDGITGGKTTLVVNDKGEGDVLFIDASGQLGSAKEQGGQVISLDASNGLNWLLLYPDGTMENYALNLASMKVAIWRNTVGNQNVAKNSLFISDCSVK
jgi:hypothetical protein